MTGYLDLNCLERHFGGCPVGKMYVQMNGQFVEILYNFWYQDEVDKENTAATVVDEEGFPLVYGEVFVCGFLEQSLTEDQIKAIHMAQDRMLLGDGTKKFILKDVRMIAWAGYGKKGRGVEF